MKSFTGSPLIFLVLKDSAYARRSSAGRAPPAVSYWFFAGAPGSTAATPSGLMLKARNISGSSPGVPHWGTRAYGSEIRGPGPLAAVLPSTVWAPVPEMIKYRAAPDRWWGRLEGIRAGNVTRVRLRS